MLHRVATWHQLHLQNLFRLCLGTCLQAETKLRGICLCQQMGRYAAVGYTGGTSGLVLVSMAPHYAG